MIMPQQPYYTVFSQAPAIIMGWWPIDINDGGFVLGASLNFYTNNPEQVVIWDSVGRMPPTILSMDPCWAFDINNNRQFVGAKDAYVGPPPPKAFVGTNANDIKDLGSPPDGPVGFPSYAKAINNYGVIAGNAGGSLLSGDDFSPRGFIYDCNTHTVNVLNPPPGYSSINVVDINDQGHVVGKVWSIADDKQHAFICKDRQTLHILVPGESVLFVTAVNNHDVITGTRQFADRVRGFRLHASVPNATFEELGPQNCDASFGESINDDGTVVLTVFPTGQTQTHGWVNFPSTNPYAGLWDLQNSITAAGWVVQPVAINNYNKILAVGAQSGSDGGVVVLSLLPSAHDVPWKMYGALAEFAWLFGGAPVEEWGLPHRGRLQPISPRQDYIALWQRLPRPAQEALVGKAVQRLAFLIDDRKSRETLQKAALDLLKS
jgi:hypothetical protein